MATLFVMCGIPGSGKSTWANAFRQNRMKTVYVSRDVIRLSIITDEEHYFSHEDEVYDKFVDTIKDALSVGIDTIADATHLSGGARNKLVKALAAKGMTTDKYEIIFVYMDVPVNECIRRDNTREGRAHVTASVIRRMGSQQTIPTTDEFPNVKEVWIIHGRDLVHQ